MYLLESKRNEYPYYLYLVSENSYLVPWQMVAEPWNSFTSSKNLTNSITLLSRQNRSLKDEIKLEVIIQAHKKINHN